MKVQYNENNTDAYEAVGKYGIFTIYEIDPDKFNGMVKYTSQDGGTMITYCAGYWLISPTNMHDYNKASPAGSNVDFKFWGDCRGYAFTYAESRQAKKYYTYWNDDQNCPEETGDTWYYDIKGIMWKGADEGLEVTCLSRGSNCAASTLIVLFLTQLCFYNYLYIPCLKGIKKH